MDRETLNKLIAQINNEIDKIPKKNIRLREMDTDYNLDGALCSLTKVLEQILEFNDMLTKRIAVFNAVYSSNGDKHGKTEKRS